jgi:hydroxypyruvate isomerase
VLNFAANLSFLFPEDAFPDRFRLAAEAGFAACEFLFPYEYAPDEIVGFLKAAGLRQALFNLPPGDWVAGDRGLAAIPGREAEFAASVETGIRYADGTGCRRLHIMSGCADPTESRHLETYRNNISSAAGRLAEAGIMALIEPINPVDIPGYFLSDFGMAARLIEEINAPNLRLQFDCYHRAMLGQNIIEGLQSYATIFGHVQIAGYPGRNEPGTGSLDYRSVFDTLLEIDFIGWIGCEYRPSGKTAEGLRWREGWI